MLKKLSKSPKYMFLFGAFCLLVSSYFSKGYHHYDEHFQILEFAGLKLDLTSASNLPWEYHQQMRPSLQPAMVVGVYKFFNLFDVQNPFAIAFFLRVLSGALTLFCLWLLYQVYKSKVKDDVLRRWFLILNFTLWFVIYIGVRFSSENWSGLLFVLGFCSFYLLPKKTFLTHLLIGVLFGLSFLFRYQCAFLVFGFFMWLAIVNRSKFNHLVGLALGFLLVGGFGVLVDRWFYNEWTLTTWNYFAQNILENKVSNFGVEPWWWYITESIVKSIPPIGFLMVVGFLTLIVAKPKSPLVWTIIPFLLIHSLIGHKEMRFLFPVYLFIPIIIIQSIETVHQRFKFQLSSAKYFKGFMRFTIVLNTIALLVIMFKPADNHISLYHTLYKYYELPTALFYRESNPYHRVLDINFYKRKSLTIQPINAAQNIHNTEHKLVVQRHRKTAEQKTLGKLIYSTYPEWIFNYNFNNWQERTAAWYVYELK